MFVNLSSWSAAIWLRYVKLCALCSAVFFLIFLPQNVLGNHGNHCRYVTISVATEHTSHFLL